MDGAGRPQRRRRRRRGDRGSRRWHPAEVQSGAAYVVFGKTTAFPAVIEVYTLNGSNGFALYGVAASDGAGGPVSRAGDVNGDGFADLIVGAASADLNGVTDAGQGYVVYGRHSFGASLDLGSLLAANGGDGSAGFAINGFLAGQNTRPTGIGDINGDGFADIRSRVPKPTTRTG